MPSQSGEKYRQTALPRLHVSFAANVWRVLKSLAVWQPQSTPIATVAPQYSKQCAIVDQLISINDTKAKVGTQLISSAYSAVNYSAGISSSSSQSQNCSTSFSFSGDIGEA